MPNSRYEGTHAPEPVTSTRERRKCGFPDPPLPWVLIGRKTTECFTSMRPPLVATAPRPASFTLRFIRATFCLRMMPLGAEATRQSEGVNGTIGRKGMSGTRNSPSSARIIPRCTDANDSNCRMIPVRIRISFRKRAGILPSERMNAYPFFSAISS